ncbi:hypothetical protein BDR05DRAFT_896193, partial [Suillus weaverae]
WVHTNQDTFSMFHSYLGAFPSYDPKNTTTFDNVCDSHTFQPADGPNEHKRPWYACFGTAIDGINCTFFTPFLNVTTFCLMSWFYNTSSGKSIANLDHLVQEVILAKDFEHNDLREFSASWEAKRMDQAGEDPNSGLFASDKWCKASVKIKLPAEKEKFVSEADTPEFDVEGLYYHKPLEVLKSAYEENSSRTFHTTPFKVFWHPDKHEFPKRIITKVYTADAMLQEHQQIKAQPQGCNLEMVVAAIMLWSDSTHLASFGHAALWPIYLFIGNQSKYLWNKPLEFAAHHLAYIPKVSLYVES